MTERFSRVFFRLLAPGLLMACALLAAPDARACGPYCDMPGDRGGVAHNIDNAIACESACDRTQGCRGWTWVKPGVQGPRAVCWIKNQIVATMRSNCCISGYRGDRTATASVRQFRLRGSRPKTRPGAATRQRESKSSLCWRKTRHATSVRMHRRARQTVSGLLGQGCSGASWLTTVPRLRGRPAVVRCFAP